jgi:uncharacterized protein (TIGR00290 family)
MTAKALLSWSSGKDSAWALHVLGQQAEVEVVGLFTTFNEAANRVAMHAVRRELVEAQARVIGLPLWPVLLPWPCSNIQYETRMQGLVQQAVSRGITYMVFGDLYLGDIRAYRQKQLAGTGLTPLFPLWCTERDTGSLARAMVAAGVRAVITCVDPGLLDGRFVGRSFDFELLEELPASVDPCGERGEFHTFCHDGPMFAEPIPVQVGLRVDRDGFYFADIKSIDRGPANRAAPRVEDRRWEGRAENLASATGHLVQE